MIEKEGGGGGGGAATMRGLERTSGNDCGIETSSMYKFLSRMAHDR